MATITADRQTIESMLSSVRAGMGDILDPPSGAALGAGIEFIAVLQKALDADRPADHETAVQAAWTASLAARDAVHAARFGVDCGERMTAIRKGFSVAAEDATSAVVYLLTADTVDDLAERTGAWTAAMETWLSTARSEVPGVGDHASVRVAAFERGCRDINAAWRSGLTALVQRLHPERQAGPRPAQDAAAAWRSAYNAAAAPISALWATEMNVAAAMRDWDIAKTAAAAG